MFLLVYNEINWAACMKNYNFEAIWQVLNNAFREIFTEYKRLQFLSIDLINSKLFEISWQRVNRTNRHTNWLILDSGMTNDNDKKSYFENGFIRSFQNFLFTIIPTAVLVHNKGLSKQALPELVVVTLST